MFIELTEKTYAGTELTAPILVNVDNIVYVTPNDNGSTVFVNGGGMIMVSDKYKSIASYLQ